MDRLIADKRAVKSSMDALWSDEHVIRDREELAEQVRALGELAEMAGSYGLDVSGPARTARQAIQWLYFGYLAAVKEQNGAAMSLGRTSTFLDVYLQRDLDEGRIGESYAQELIDDLVIKLLIVRFLRTPEYDALFSGDPTWVTEAIGGMGDDRRTLVTALLGIAGFVLYAIFGIVLLRTDRPLAALGRAAQSVWNRVTRGRRPVTGLDQRLLAERDTIRSVLGTNWWRAVLLTAGRLGLDYGCLLAALRATGVGPRPSLVLLAYAAAGIIALFPVTPGGLGIVEASLSGLLILAGVHPGPAFLATLAYRIASYWLPLLAGPPAYLLFRHRYGRPAPRPATSGGAGTAL